jgi:hypothetical protein
MSLEYKFVEVVPVTEDSLGSAVNAKVAIGWQLDAIHFVRRDGSHRPAMAFISFIRECDESAES